jgi:hypothetical protein
MLLLQPIRSRELKSYEKSNSKLRKTPLERRRDAKKNTGGPVAGMDTKLAE